MSPRLTTAIKISRNAEGLLHTIEAIGSDEMLDDSDHDIGALIGIEPMLLAFSMELALKAWIVFDHNKTNVKKTHNLLTLFEILTPATQAKLESEFKQSVAPYYPSGIYVEFGIKDLLHQHAEAFKEWRYSYESPRPMTFEKSSFIATLKMMLAEFKKQYTEVQITPPSTR